MPLQQNWYCFRAPACQRSVAQFKWTENEYGLRFSLHLVYARILCAAAAESMSLFTPLRGNDQSRRCVVTINRLVRKNREWVHSDSVCRCNGIDIVVHAAACQRSVAQFKWTENEYGPKLHRSLFRRCGVILNLYTAILCRYVIELVNGRLN